MPNLLKANTESSEHMLNFIISFSEILKTSVDYFMHSFDSEKVEIINQIFSELYFSDEGLKYVAKQGFSALLARSNPMIAPLGAAQYLFSELENIYPILKASVNSLNSFNQM